MMSTLDSMKSGNWTENSMERQNENKKSETEPANIMLHRIPKRVEEG